jgi:hypothetical protein
MQNISPEDVCAAAYRALVAALHRRELTVDQASALRAILLSLHTAARLIEDVEQRFPEYAHKPELMTAARAGIGVAVLDAFRRELAALVAEEGR